jgi:hypothetical protein
MSKCDDDDDNELCVQSIITIIITDITYGYQYRGAIYCQTFPHY